MPRFGLETKTFDRPPSFPQTSRIIEFQPLSEGLSCRKTPGAMADLKLNYDFIIVDRRRGDHGGISLWLAKKEIQLSVVAEFSEAKKLVSQRKGRLVALACLAPPEDEALVQFAAYVKTEASEVPVWPVEEEDLKNLEAWPKNFDKVCKPRLDQLIENQELLTAFADDIFPLLEKLDQLVVQIEAGGPQGENLPAYMRILHTIKGTASSIGFKKVGEFAHKYEDFVSSIQKGERALNVDSIQKISKGYDQLKKVLNEAMTGILADGASESIMALFTEAMPMAGGDAGPLQAQQGNAQGGAAAATDEKIFVSLETLNEFIDASSRLVTIRSAFQQTIARLALKLPNDPDVRAMQTTSRQFDKEITKLQSTAEDLRKVSLSTVFRPLRRMVRETSKALGKKINFEIDGEELLVDRLISSLLSNCLVHLLRNCVDHGIETAEERVPQGKPEEGTISIVIRQQDDSVTILIRDDGKGINPAIIRKKALQIGLFTEDQLAAMTENEIQMIIFAAGFSTAATVSDISGRGVGTDMVKRSVEEAGGRLKLNSTVGKGTEFQIYLPIPNNSLVMKVILIKMGRHVFAVQRDEIVSIISYALAKERKTVFDAAGGMTVYFGDEYFPVLQPQLEKEAGSSFNESDACLILMRNETQKFCVFVDEVLANEECIGMNLDEFTRSGVQNFEKATLLGNSKLALLADCATLLRLCEPKDIVQVSDDEDSEATSA